MPTLDRRQFLKLAAALGATLAWGCAPVRPSSSGWRERRDLYPQGVASGDPDDNSVLLWTRRPYADGRKERHAAGRSGGRSGVHARHRDRRRRACWPQSDWTCRVLVGDLQPAREYWYRFVDEDGNGSRIGRTLTAPAPDDPRPARFAFVSCQSLPEGALNAYRRMIFEDERAAPEERLGFVLHLGDFIYEVVQYPDQVKNGHRYDRVITFPIKFPKGKAVAKNRFWVPDSLDDYRALYHAYLQDPDLQDARARWPFVAMWDNHEFSWQGWQSIQEFAGRGLGARADAQGRGEPGLVRIPAGARVAAGLAAGHLRCAARGRHAGQRFRRRRPGHRSQQPRRDRQPDRLSRLALGPAHRPDHHRPAQLPLARPRQPRRDQPAVRKRHPGLRSRGDCGRSSTPAATTPTAIRRRSCPSATRAWPITAPAKPRRRCWARSRKPGSSSACAARAPPGRSGAIRWARPTGASIRRIFRPRWANGPDAGYAPHGDRRLGRHVPRARRDLRRRARCRHHRFRDRGRRSPQLLGGLRGEGLAARRVRAGGRHFRGRLDLFPGHRPKPTSTT